MKIIRMDKSSITAYFTSTLCWFFGLLTLEKWAVVVGIVCTIGSFIHNIYHKRQIRKELQKKKWVSDDD